MTPIGPRSSQWVAKEWRNVGNLPVCQGRRFQRLSSPLFGSCLDPGGGGLLCPWQRPSSGSAIVEEAGMIPGLMGRSACQRTLEWAGGDKSVAHRHHPPTDGTPTNILTPSRLDIMMLLDGCTGLSACHAHHPVPRRRPRRIAQPLCPPHRQELQGGGE